VSEENSRPTPDILDEATRALRDAPVPAGPPVDLTAATVAAVKNQLAGIVPSEQARRERRRRIMRYIGFGTATAATLAIVTLAGVTWLGSGRAIAFEKVLDKVKQAESVTFVEKQKLGDQAEIELVYSIRGPSVRVEAPGTVIIIDTKEKTGLMLAPAAKVYEKIDKGSPNKIHGPAGASPIDDLLKLKDRKPESTVEEKLDGKTVQKLTIKGDPKADPPGDWVIWVDPKTELPVKMTYTGTTHAGDKQVSVTKTYEKFAWNAKLDDTLFDMKVPEGYTEGLQGPPPPEVLFLKVVDRVASATSMRAVITADAGEGAKVQMKLYQQGAVMRLEATDVGFIVIMNGNEKKGLVLLTQMKTAQWIDLNKAEQANKIAGNVGGAMKAIGALKGEKVAALPDQTLDGRKLKVYELKAVKVKELPGEGNIKVWIDPKLLLPVRFELQTKQEDRIITATVDILGWNEELDESLFELKIPGGYKIIEQP
jgi:outer membrane lipoprotein-sorting protein